MSALKEIKMLECKCEKCKHKWITRSDEKPKICPNCKSPYWEIPEKTRKKQIMTYDKFKDKIKKILTKNKKICTEGLGWSEIQSIGNFYQKVLNNRWVRQLEKDIGLIREKKGNKMIWRIVE